MKSRTPAKVILFGEHAVVYGEPALAMAINLYSTVDIEKSDELLIDNSPPDRKYHSFILTAYEKSGFGLPVHIRVRSSFSPSSGLGSSASVTVGTVSSLLAISGRWSKEEIARIAFETEYSVQGRASPTDTSTVTSGGGIIISRNDVESRLWRIEKNGIEWNVGRIDIKPLELIVASSGIRGSTALLVSKVNSFVSRNRFGMDVIREIGEISRSAITPLMDGDLETIGELMVRNNKLLNILGVGHELTTRIIDSVLPYSYGAKITGAGGGGSVLILPRERDAIIEKLKSMGIKYFRVSMDREGVTLLK
ncbi:MAG: mevalonate kinase [Thermoplasmata archaeon]